MSDTFDGHGQRPPSRLHRVNGWDANMTLIQAMRSVRGGEWFHGAPTHVAAELLGELAERGYFLGVADRDEPRPSATGSLASAEPQGEASYPQAVSPGVMFTAAERDRLLWWLYKPTAPGPMKDLDVALIRKIEAVSPAPSPDPKAVSE